MLKMIKTLIKAVFYIVFVSILVVFTVYLIQDLITYYLVADAPQPLILRAVGWIMSIPVLSNIIEAFLTVLT